MQFQDLPSAPAKLLLFVYGTLMQGEANHALLEGVLCVEEPTWVSAYELWASHSYYPKAFFNPNRQIRGEMY